MTILIINGPNLNLLGVREPNIYGTSSYDDLITFLNNLAIKLNLDLIIKQTNHEGTIIDYLHEAYYQHYAGVIINPGAYTHYSYAIYDAIMAIKETTPTIEVHLTDITERDSFRNISIITPACLKTFMGHHFTSYEEALKFLYEYLRKKPL